MVEADLVTADLMSRFRKISCHEDKDLFGYFLIENKNIGWYILPNTL